MSTMTTQSLETAPRRVSAAPGRPTWGDAVAQTAAIVDTPAFYGPPISFVLGPWLLLVLLISGPFALLVTLVLVAAVAAGLLALLVAVIASPFLLTRRLRAHGMPHRWRRAAPHVFQTHPAGPGRLGSPQPKGMS